VDERRSLEALASHYWFFFVVIYKRCIYADKIEIYVICEREHKCNDSYTGNVAKNVARD
jgi:hypothetical protein